MTDKKVLEVLSTLHTSMIRASQDIRQLLAHLDLSHQPEVVATIAQLPAAAALIRMGWALSGPNTTGLPPGMTHWQCRRDDESYSCTAVYDDNFIVQDLLRQVQTRRPMVDGLRGQIEDLGWKVAAPAMNDDCTYVTWTAIRGGDREISRSGHDSVEVLYRLYTAVARIGIGRATNADTENPTGGCTFAGGELVELDGVSAPLHLLTVGLRIGMPYVVEHVVRLDGGGLTLIRLSDFPEIFMDAALFKRPTAQPSEDGSSIAS